MPQQFEKTTPTVHSECPFCKDIAKVLIPKQFVVAEMRLYDGTDDPYDHVAAYKGAMMTVPLRIS